jgi:hypothetical protein
VGAEEIVMFARFFLWHNMHPMVEPTVGFPSACFLFLVLPDIQ